MSSHPGRRYDLDWLRIAAVYLLFPFHVAMIFNPAPFYHIRNDELCFGMLIFAGFVSLWHMPLFFLLAGWSAYASLARRGARGFLGERLRKLAVPLVAGCVLLVPPIKYLELRNGLDANHTGLYVSAELQSSFAAVAPGGLPLAKPFDESFLEFVPSFFTDAERFSWSHLWFIAYLLTFTLLYLPLLLWAMHRVPARSSLPGARLWVYAPVLPLALIQVALRARWPGLQNLYDDWANVAYYSVYLLSGFLLARVPALEAAIDQEWRRAFVLAAGGSGVLLAAVLGAVTSPGFMPAATAVTGWSCVVGLLGMARRHLMRPGARLSYLSESAFPVYVLHQPAIVLLGAPILALPLGVAPKFVAILGAALAVVGLVYHFGVRRLAPLRFLLGMKPAGPALLPGARHSGGSRPEPGGLGSSSWGPPTASSAHPFASSPRRPWRSTSRAEPSR